MNIVIARTLALLLLTTTALQAQVPQLINYQGRVAVGGVNFDGSGQFKFALVDAGGTTAYWSNDGTGTRGSEPAAAVTITVGKGLYSVLLGDASLPNMTVIPAGVIDNSDVFLRVWFNNGSNGSQQLKPDQRLATTSPVNARNVRGGSPPAATDCWQERATPTPAGRRSHTAVWTGSEMIVWGGYNGTSHFGDGGRYDPAGDSWTAMSTVGAPVARRQHTAVWTGSEMIVWGGYNGVSSLSDGGRYHPATNSWTAVSTAGAPAARRLHTAVWTGSEMIVWGGSNLNTGGRYNPTGNIWTALTTTGAPSVRYQHAAVWTGSEMIIWGGRFVNTGGRYDPEGDSWTAVSAIGAPPVQDYYAAVWTGGEMIVWGGTNLNPSGGPPATGGRYHPAGNSWTEMSTTGAPATNPHYSGVWTGSEMIVWGSGDWYDSGRYNPAANRWTAVNSAGSSSAGGNGDYSVIWTGSEMIIWGGGVTDTGGRYAPTEDSWKPVSTTAPASRQSHTAVWTGSELIVWGGAYVIGSGQFSNTGGRYDPALNSWTRTSTAGAPAGRSDHTAVWTGSEMIVWGGIGGAGYLNTGGRYRPAGDNWTTVDPTGAPAVRFAHTAVWTGSEMIVWGGARGGTANGGDFNDGGRYDPAGDSWTAVTTTGAPAARWHHKAVWTGSEMIVWGGMGLGIGGNGGRYKPALNSWTAVSTAGAPDGHMDHTMVWTGHEMIVWGGSFYFGGTQYQIADTGGRYNPADNSWTAVTTTGAPAARTRHTAVWTGSEMIIWGGNIGSNTGGRYNPAGNVWTPMTTTGAPSARYDHSAVWTGSEIIVWGGTNSNGSIFNDTFSYLTDGGVFDITSVVRSGGNLTLSFPTVAGRTYTLWHSGILTSNGWIDTGLTALAGTGATLTFTVPATTPARRFFRVQSDPLP